MTDQPWHTNGAAPLHLAQPREPRTTKPKATGRTKPATAASERKRLEHNLANEIQKLEGAP